MTGAPAAAYDGECHAILVCRRVEPVAGYMARPALPRLGLPAVHIPRDLRRHDALLDVLCDALPRALPRVTVAGPARRRDDHPIALAQPRAALQVDRDPHAVAHE